MSCSGVAGLISQELKMTYSINGGVSQSIDMGGTITIKLGDNLVVTVAASFIFAAGLGPFASISGVLTITDPAGYIIDQVSVPGYNNGILLANSAVETGSISFAPTATMIAGKYTLTWNTGCAGTRVIYINVVPVLNAYVNNVLAFSNAVDVGTNTITLNSNISGQWTVNSNPPNAVVSVNASGNTATLTLNITQVLTTVYATVTPAPTVSATISLPSASSGIMQELSKTYFGLPLWAWLTMAGGIAVIGIITYEATK